ncbi:STAS domain-containing protein [Syntrophomonas wolfei]|uniref:STAS domain-containing protein n=1 Tax=Syntrophomonas wolfei subsp. wolfei (strain DSM 2245B / Goettingen) TaxID=335541 RepID=Q0AW10_SYNWW|nr:STAS domain-containing protein [Syntrophomonas wolfei]ABI69094.1 hypothetical protein Swol_1796 [Syntrophomonas wolfei subsp. wolfei str. Goettingen G311]
MLNVAVSTRENIPLISLQGRFDGLGSQLFEQEIGLHLKEEKYWLIDFSNVNYLSSAGIRSLLKYGKMLAKVKGKLILMGLNREVKSVMEMTGVLQLFGQAEGMADALALIAREQTAQGGGQIFSAGGREYSWQLLSRQESYLDIWKAVHGSSLQGLSSSDLMAAGLDELELAFGIGGLGFDCSNAFEGLGSFLALDKMAGVLPADNYNHPDFMVVKDPQEAVVHIAAAVGFSGAPWGKLDLPEGEAITIRDIRKLISDKLQSSESQELSLLGLVILGQVQAGEGAYYRNFEDLTNNKPLKRELPRQQSMLLLGLGADSGWKAEEHLLLLMEQRGIRAGEEFFQGNALLFADLLDWENIHEPREIMNYCNELDLMQDVFMAGEDTAISAGRVWFFVPGHIRSAEEKQLEIAIRDGISFPEEWQIITRRLYADARRVVLEPLQGGFSLGKPFRVTSYDREQRRMLPTVLKIGPHSLIEKEIENHQKYVQGYILNNSTTIMGVSSCGESTGMRYNFVGISGPDSNLDWLTHRFQEKALEELIPLFDTIFTRILKPWYGQPRWEKIKPYQEHDPLLRFPVIFDFAEEKLGISVQDKTIDCPELGRVLPNPYHFLKYQYPARQSISRLWYTGINHGDLNMQNILLDERDNVYIIDFSDTRPRNIVSDFARLEPIFKFEMTLMENEQDLRSFLEFEQALARVNTLDELPPLVYHGNDPALEKVYRMTCLIRKYAKTVVIFENDILPYLLAMLEWTYPIVLYVNVTPCARKAATYSAALIVEQILRLEG